MPSQAYLESAAKLAKAKPQESIAVVPGMSVRKTKNGIPVLRVHYSADPDRDPKTPKGAEWRAKKRKEYTSQADWDRENEIKDVAGGGERIYAEILGAYFNKIVITDPSWRPGPTWATIPGFDYGKTSPTAATVAMVDHDGNIYFVAEYYQPGLDIWEHAPFLKDWPLFMNAEDVMCDPSIFTKSMQDRTGKAIAVAEIYADFGITNLRPYIGNKQDIGFEQRLKFHWANLAEREPTVKIWAPGLTEIPDRPVYGQHDGCPSLLWELAHIRRVKLTATQLMAKNPSEQIQDKDNHAHDAMKYVVMTLPEPTAKSTEMRVKEAIQECIERGDVTNAMRIAQDVKEQIAEEEAPSTMLSRFAEDSYPGFGQQQLRPLGMRSRFGRR